MVSDGRVLAAALEKASCRACGYGFHSSPLTVDERDQLYDDSYDLGLQDAAADEARAVDYAEVVTTFIDQHVPGYRREGLSIIEFGCGTGALLDRLVQQWQAAPSLGIEAASGLVQAAQARIHHNMEVLEGFAESLSAPASPYDLCVSVNVVEHALDPVRFLAACKASVSGDGLIVTICPDGDQPSTELLFRDHVSSFSAASFALVAAKAGLRVLASTALVGRQSGFCIYLLRHQSDTESASVFATAELTDWRHRYLSGWQDLEEATLAGIADRPYAIFGLGEFANLVRAYCPRIADRAQCYVADRPVQSIRDGREVLDTAKFLLKPIVLLAAIHPRSWPLLQGQLRLDAEHLVHPYQFCSLRTQL